MTSSQTNTTVDHDEISRWAESTSAARLGFAVPATATRECCASTSPAARARRASSRSRGRVVRDVRRARLALVYQHREADGEDITLAKLVRRDRVS